ncbi:MAG: MCP four helix bundle domain-containing protein, partial [Deltaproteobacteria bacterium]|nr:MCP four helix bundle domain-containing protein [Deltaproteobacteria bacterium]
MLQNLKIRTKLISGFLAMALVAGGIGLVAYYSLGGIQLQIDEIGYNRLPSLICLYDISDAQNIIDGAENALLSTKISDDERKEFFKKMDEHKQQAGKAWKQYESLPQTPEEKKVWDQ